MAMSRTEEMLTAIIEGKTVDFEPRSRAEQYLKNCIDKCGCDGLPAPRSRMEALLYELSEELAGGGGGIPDGYIKPSGTINITENGTYDVTQYASANVNVQASGGENYVELPPEAFVLTGDLSARFQNNNWNWYADDFGDQVTTNDITNMTNAFQRSTELERINITFNLSQQGANLSQVFYNCAKLLEPPKITGKVTMLASAFNGCKLLRFSENYFNEIELLLSTNNRAVFAGCNNIRKIPAGFFTSASIDIQPRHVYDTLFNHCNALDEIIGLPVALKSETSNAFSAICFGCGRLKRFTFATNNGAPFVVEWKSQTINLYHKDSVGYFYNDYTEKFLDKTSGITADKEVKDDVTYQALKNDPDWYTKKAVYSRYNHDSAVETINSLPDTSAYLAANGGTNTIQFSKPCGSATDGGAIGTLTEAEIAVAAAKGWTVSLAN